MDTKPRRERAVIISAADNELDFPEYNPSFKHLIKIIL